MTRSLISLCLLLAVSVTIPAATAQSGCQTGAAALGNAYVRSYFIYEIYFGDLETYVASENSHFFAGADAIRCANALANVLVNRSIGSYDANDHRRRQEIRVELETMGISGGTTQSSMSEQLLAMGMQLNRLARVLPPAANGNYGPLNTPQTEMEQLQQFAEIMLRNMLADPYVALVFQRLEPLIRELAELDYKLILSAARSLP